MKKNTYLRAIFFYAIFFFRCPFNSSVVFIIAQTCQCLLGAYISNAPQRGMSAVHSGEIPRFSDASPAHCLCIWSCSHDGQIDVVIAGTSSLFHAPPVSHEWDWSGIRNEMPVNSIPSRSPTAPKATARQIFRPYPWFFCVENPPNDVLFDFLKRRVIFTKCHWHAGSRNGFVNENLRAHFVFCNCDLAA